MSRHPLVPGHDDISGEIVLSIEERMRVTDARMRDVEKASIEHKHKLEVIDADFERVEKKLERVDQEIGALRPRALTFGAVFSPALAAVLALASGVAFLLDLRAKVERLEAQVEMIRTDDSRRSK